MIPVRRDDSNYNLKKLEKYPRPGNGKPRIDLHEVMYVATPYKLEQTIYVGHKYFRLTETGGAAKAATYFADPSKEPVLWYVQPPYHTVIVFRNIKYALIAVEYMKKATDIRNGKLIYTIDRRMLNMRRMLDLPSEAEAWIDQKIGEALGTRSRS